MSRNLVGVVVVISILSIAAFVGTPRASAALSGPDYLHVTAFSVERRNDQGVRLTAITDADIPQQPDKILQTGEVGSAYIGAGFAWLDWGTGKAFVAILHINIEKGPSSNPGNQDPGGWHALAVTLAPPAFFPDDFCIGSVDSSPNAGINFHHNSITVNVKQGALLVPPADLDTAFGFTVRAPTVFSEDHFCLRAVLNGGDNLGEPPGGNLWYRVPNPLNEGYQFRAGKDMLVTGLGYYVPRDAVGGPTVLAIWDDSGNRLGTCTPGGVADMWGWCSISPAVHLVAGQAYRVSVIAWEHAVGISWPPDTDRVQYQGTYYCQETGTPGNPVGCFPDIPDPIFRTYNIPLVDFWWHDLYV